MPDPDRLLEMLVEGVAALPEILAPDDPDGFRAERKLEQELGAPLLQLLAGGTIGDREFAVTAGWVELIAADLDLVRTKFPERYRDVCNLLAVSWLLLDDTVKM